MYTTVFNIYNNNELVEHQIRMISDWSNDAENSTLMSKLHFTINSYRKKSCLRFALGYALWLQTCQEAQIWMEAHKSL